MKAIIITPCLKCKIKDAVTIEKDDLVICADTSFAKALSEDIRIDLILGDFDTGSAVPFPDGIEIIKYPIEKDDTDTMLAIKEAARRGYSQIAVVGGLSGRLDHTYANIQSLAYGVKNGLDIRISDGDNEAFIMIPGRLHLPNKKGFSLSVFSYGENVNGLSLDGVKYPVQGASITSFFPLGISNSIISKEAEISFSEGLLLIILSKLN